MPFLLVNIQELVDKFKKAKKAIVKEAEAKPDITPEEFVLLINMHLNMLFTETYKAMQKLAETYKEMQK